MRRELEGGYDLDDDAGRIDLDVAHAFLTDSYWATGRSRETVERLVDGASRVIGLYRDGDMVGFCRVESDEVTYAILLDVFVLDMRTYRNANSPDDQTVDPQGILGREQLEWLKRELSRSRAVWKVIASDMPLGLVVPDTTEGKANIEAVAQGDPGAPLGRELQIAELLHARGLVGAARVA